MEDHEALRRAAPIVLSLAPGSGVTGRAPGNRRTGAGGQASLGVSKPKIALCTILLASATRFMVEYTPRVRWDILRYCLACSSDQRKTFSRQKSSTMLGAWTSHISTSGMKTIGAAPGWSQATFMSLSTWRVIGSEQCTHSVSTVTGTGSLIRRPCTKGVAIASAAQAAYRVSPDLNLIRCGVGSAVTG